MDPEVRYPVEPALVPQAVAIADSLKRALRARGITYAALAARIRMSEASVKRMFAKRTFTLARLNAICDAAGIDFAALTRGFNPEERLIARLTTQQEAAIVAEPRLFLTAICVLNLLDFDDIIALYKLESAELVGLLTRLDRIGFIELLPNDRIKLLVARTFAWIPNGPIMQAFKRNSADFFDSDFRQARRTDAAAERPPVARVVDRAGRAPEARRA